MAENITDVILISKMGKMHFLGSSYILNQDFHINGINILIFVITVMLVLFINMAVLMWVKVKERVLVDNMITVDCISNLLLLVTVFMAFPWKFQGNLLVCAGATFFRGFTITLNR